MRLKALISIVLLTCVSPASAFGADILNELRRAHVDLMRLQSRAEHPRGTADVDGLQSLTYRLESLAADTAALAKAGDPVAEQKRRQLVALAADLQQKIERQAPRKSFEDLAAVTADGAVHGHAACAGAETLAFGSYLVPRLSLEKAHGARWFRFQAPFDGRFHVDTLGSSADTRLGLFAACDGPALRSNDDSRGLAAALGFDAAQGKTFWLRLDGDGPGHVVLQLRGTSTDPSLLKNAQVLAKRGASVLSGTVTDSDGGALHSLRIELYRNEGDYWSYAWSEYTDGLGSFRFTGLSAGSYKVKTDFYSSTRFLNQIYPLTNCQGSCSPNFSGESIALDGTDLRTDIDFVLSEGSMISGWVQDKDGVGIAGAYVKAWDAIANVARSDSTDAAGRYRLVGLLDGELRVTASAAQYNTVGWDGVPCPGSCNEPVGDPITVPVESHVSGIDFILAEKGGVTGRAVDVLGDPISDLSVVLYDSAGNYMESTSTDSSGIYSFAGIEAGDHFVVAQGYEFSDELWDDLPCQGGCDQTTGTAVVVAEENVTTGIDFVLNRLGIIEGQVQSAGPRPFSDRVGVFNSKGHYVAGDYPDTEGRYRFALPAGIYYVVTPPTSDHYGEAWDGRPCDGYCDPLTGDPIIVGLDSTVGSIDFNLRNKASISGRVTVQGAAPNDLHITLFDETGSSLKFDYLYNYEPDFSFRGLSAGTYYVGVESSWTYQSHMPQMYDGVPCAATCDPLTGTPIVVTDGAVIENLDLDLDRKPVLRGTLKDATSGADLSDVRVRVFNAGGSSVYSKTAYNGTFQITGLYPGTYYLVLEKSGFVAQLWQSLSCFPSVSQGGCTVTDGSPVVLSLGNETEIDVLLQPGGGLAGRSTEIAGGQPLGSSIQVFDSLGRQVASTSASSADGTWAVGGLVDGNYRVRSSPGYLYMSMAWPSVYCSNGFTCSELSGTAITVSGGAVVGGIDFGHHYLGTISGRLTDAETGEPISGRVYLYDISNQYQGNVVAGPDGSYRFVGLGAGNFFAVTAGNSSYLDENYGLGVCEPTCMPNEGTPIHLNLFDQVTGIDFSLERSKGARGRVTSLSTGAPLAGVAIDFWYPSGNLARTAVSDVDGRFEAFNINNSSVQSYYVSTHNTLGYTDQLWGGVSCPDGSAYEGLCDQTLGAPYEQREDSPVFEMNFALGDASVLFMSGFESGVVDWSSASGL